MTARAQCRRLVAEFDTLYEVEFPDDLEQAKYEAEEADTLTQAREYQRQGHSLQCAAGMAWRGEDCICEMENWRIYDRMER